jgi:ATP-dependent Clp protease adaptor protein ClpS
MSTITKKKNKSQVDKIVSQPYKLILHNDDFNSFDWVITCLMKICGHEYEQANQCAHIVHFKGECDVKYGDFEKISEMKKKLSDAGLSVTMESTN